MREVAVWAQHEARGAAARERERGDRALVAESAADVLTEQLILSRLLQHVTTGGEAAMMHAEFSRILHEVLAEGLARQALSHAQRRADVREGSAVLGRAHSRLAYGAMFDELLAQLQRLSPSGFDAPRPRGGAKSGGGGGAPKEAWLHVPSESDESDAEGG